MQLINPCILVIFGATGDLTARKLIPALFYLHQQELLPSAFACVGFARRPKTHEQFQTEMHTAVTSFSKNRVEPSTWDSFKKKLFYHTSTFDDDHGYQQLKLFLDQLDQSIQAKGNRIFYISTGSSYFSLILEKLAQANLISKNNKSIRVVLEKPFGEDLPSAITLQQKIAQHLDESQTYRIDHYLGKETVQNLLYLRCANAVFEPLWNHHYIDHIQITVAEQIGIGTRGAFFEKTGIVRDIIQNHMMQLLALVAMEPPIHLDAESIRNEKVKVIEAIQPIGALDSVAGQYSSGTLLNQEVASYIQEANVNPHSSIETFAAFKLYIKHPRWQGMPFYVRSGKRLAQQSAHIAIVFKKKFSLFGNDVGHNVLLINLQPLETISLYINCKIPSISQSSQKLPILERVSMDFSYPQHFKTHSAEAYARLIHDVLVHDRTLFARNDEVLAAWKLFTPVLDSWKKNPCIELYPSGSWGPNKADLLMHNDQRSWI